MSQPQRLTKEQVIARREAARLERLRQEQEEEEQTARDLAAIDEEERREREAKEAEKRAEEERRRREEEEAKRREEEEARAQAEEEERKKRVAERVRMQQTGAAVFVSGASLPAGSKSPAKAKRSGTRDLEDKPCYLCTTRKVECKRTKYVHFPLFL